eukprot:Tamp_07515.p1 GENE.Tamp_07515~~Tamp_07515.p1  ORF type:complete len:297 (-),score=63.23 Tamp_07515:855-1745(-)
MDQQREAHMLEQEKLCRSHAQAVEVLNLKISSLEKRLQDERAESAGQIQDIEQRLREYEDALDELERDHEAKTENAILETRLQCEADHANMLAEHSKSREREQQLQARVDLLEHLKREEVTKIMVEWEGVYKELEQLYFTAKEESERKTELLVRSKRDLDRANQTIAQLSDEQHRYTENIEWMKKQLDARRAGSAAVSSGARCAASAGGHSSWAGGDTEGAKKHGRSDSVDLSAKGWGTSSEGRGSVGGMPLVERENERERATLVAGGAMSAGRSCGRVVGTVGARLAGAAGRGGS